MFSQPFTKTGYLLRKTLLLTVLFLLIQNVDARCPDISKSSTYILQEQLDQEIESYYSLIEQSLHHRHVSHELFIELEHQLQQSEHLTSAQLLRFKQSITTHLELRERLYQVAHARECWLNSSHNSMDPELRLHGVMLSLSSALTLYDNYLLIVAMFQQNHLLRRIIDQPDKGFGLSSNQLLEASLAYHSLAKREKVKKGIRFYKQNIDAVFSTTEKSSLLYLRSLIEQSPSWQILQDNSLFSILQNKFKFYTIITSDTLKLLEKEGINLLSLIFGNSIGMIESRKGKLYQHKEAEKQLSQSLRAGDILLEKTPFRLTDQFIPGYWGHAAIWIGNEKELRELQLWNHELIKPWHEQIRSGNAIIEALRSGVSLNPLNHFMNIDDVVVLREQSISRKNLRQVIINAFRQIGKSYDFNFDVNSTDRIVCSELIYISYPHIRWPTEKTLGRYTISPDHIVHKVREKRLKVITFYLDGQAVTRDQHITLLKTLTEQPLE